MMSIRATQLALGAMVAAFAFLPLAGRATTLDGADRPSLLATLATWAASPISGTTRASLAASMGDVAFSIQVEVTRGRAPRPPGTEAREPADRPLRGMVAVNDPCSSIGLGRPCDAAFLAEVEIGTSCASLARSVFAAFEMPVPESVRAALGAAAKLRADGALDIVRSALQASANLLPLSLNPGRLNPGRGPD